MQHRGRVRRGAEEKPVGGWLAAAAGQCGVITSDQLLDAGLTRHAVAHRVRVGWLRRLHRGVFVVGPVSAPFAREMAAVLASGTGAAVGVRSAAGLWELRPLPDAGVDVVLTRRGVRSSNGIRVHTAADLPATDVTTRHGIPITTPLRTLLDLAAVATAGELERAVQEAQVRGLVTADQLRRRAAGVRGAPAIRAALALEPALTRSEAERRLLALIRAAELPQPRTNVRVGPHEVDAVWTPERVVVEIDGYAYHGTRAAFERDRRRDADLAARRYTVLRFTWRELTRRPEAVVARIAAVLAR